VIALLGEIEQYSREQAGFRLMLTRGLLMLLHIEHLAEDAWYRVTFLIVAVLESIFYQDQVPIPSDSEVMQFLGSLSNTSLLFYVNKLQAILTFNIEAEDAEFDLLEDLTRLIDVLWRVGQSKGVPAKAY
jgi:hypothetical protein